LFLVDALLTKVLVASVLASLEYSFLNVVLVATVANDVVAGGVVRRLPVVRIEGVSVGTLQINSLLDEWHALFSFIACVLLTSVADVLVALPLAPLEAICVSLVDFFQTAQVAGNIAAEWVLLVAVQIVVIHASGL